MKKNFQRKVIYISVMALLLVPLSYLSRPASTEDSGGLLAVMRDEHRLSPAQLGEIDPAGASMNLATLGMRGVAANILWTRALDYREREDWTSMKATVNQITKLQPHFISAWRFQAWELSYNVAAEFDDQRHRYTWVKKGVDFLQQGIRYNRHEPLLVWDMGWFFGHKLGRSDDRRQFRQFYADDTDFHETLPVDIDKTRGPNNKPDNWLAGHQLYKQSERVLDESNVPLRGKNPLLFHADPAMALIYHAIAIEDEGHLDKDGQEAWRRAGDEFRRYGNKNMPTRLGEQVRLNDLQRVVDQAVKAKEELDELVPGVHEELEQDLVEQLLPAEREALNTPPEQRSLDQLSLADLAFSKDQSESSGNCQTCRPRETSRGVRGGPASSSSVTARQRDRQLSHDSKLRLLDDSVPRGTRRQNRPGPDSDGGSEVGIRPGGLANCQTKIRARLGCLG